MDVEKVASIAEARGLECRARLDVLEVAFSMLAAMVSPEAAMRLESEMRAAPERGSATLSNDPAERARLEMADLFAVRLADVLAARIARQQRPELGPCAEAGGLGGQL